MKLDFRSRILTGIVVLVPIVVTFLVLRMVFLWLDGLAQPILKSLFQRHTDIPGLGIVLTLVVIYLAGLLAGNVFGRRLIGWGDLLLARLPIIGSIYSPVKQFIENVVSAEKKEGFHRVVLAEYPSEGLWILGFATGEIRLSADGKKNRCVFVPTSPNPATGWMVVFPPEKVRDTPLTVEEAMRLIVSGGLVVPEALKSLGAYGSPPERVPSFPGLGSEPDRSEPPQPDVASEEGPEASPSNSAQAASSDDSPPGGPPHSANNTFHRNKAANS